MNDLFAAFGLLDWKPLAGALLLPPVPLLLITFLAWRVRARRPIASTLFMLLATIGLWFSMCSITGRWLERQWAPTTALSPTQVSDWRRSLAGRKPVVLVLGGGVQRLAPEYGESNLGPESMARLHYGLWLGRQLQAPVMVSGGIGRSQAAGPAEADVAARITSRDYGRSLRWLETGSVDTRDNARKSLQLLRSEGIHDADGEVWLQTYPRVLGYVFKPVSFWHCERADGSLAAIVVEVNNTFGERHCYLLAGEQLGYGRDLQARKVFHVSPFSQIVGGYRFRFLHSSQNGVRKTVARIDYHDRLDDDAAGPLLQTSVSGTLEPLTRASLRKALWRYPAMTLSVMARIHWQAFRLWRKKIPFISKPDLPQNPVTR